MNLGNGYEAIYGQLTDVSLEAGQKVQKAARIGAVAAPTKYYVKEGSNLFFEMKKDEKPLILWYISRQFRIKKRTCTKWDAGKYYKV